jgi:hypothetical protein
MMYLRAFFPDARTMDSIFKTLQMMEWISVWRTVSGQYRAGLLAIILPKIDFVTSVSALFSLLPPFYNQNFGFFYVPLA